MVSAARVEFALTHLPSADWKFFETFASQFLAADFPDLRTVASPAGDMGRDAELYSPNADPIVVLQYSVAEDWRQKILDTAKLIKKNLPSAKLLIYATNQLIGASGDNLKEQSRGEFGIFLDYRDRNWFVERCNADETRKLASESLVARIVDPLLKASKVIDSVGIALTEPELRAALLYLALKWEDDNKEKGLTKLAFEAIVLSILRDTSSDHRVSGKEIETQAQQILPNHDGRTVKLYVRAALGRMHKKIVRVDKAHDTYCLSHEQIAIQKGRLAEIEKENRELDIEISTSFANCLPRGLKATADQLTDLTARFRTILGQFFMTRGELFAIAVNTRSFTRINVSDLRDIVIKNIAKAGLFSGYPVDPVELFAQVTNQIISSDHHSVRKYLKGLSNSYTLLAFLRQTPDIQAAIRKLFSNGEIWIDTSIALPFFGELLVNHDQRMVTNTIRAAQEAGMKFYVTPGVIEEIERHMKLALFYSQKTFTQWRGRIPYLYSFFVSRGMARAGLREWLEKFRGEKNPERDLSEYLQEKLGIETRSLEDLVETADEKLKFAIMEIWSASHEKRRQVHGAEYDQIAVERLARHDVENYLGVVEKRKKEDKAPGGFSSWWLTLDRQAFSVELKLKSVIDKVPQSPVMSPDFLLSYLQLGPNRGRVSELSESELPVSIDAMQISTLTPELSDLADRVREESKDQDELVIRRRVRDSLEDAKRNPGALVYGGLESIDYGDLTTDTDKQDQMLLPIQQ